jgi:hypothetical protein
VNNNEDWGSSSVTVYGPSANGNVAPLQDITAMDTGLDSPQGIAVDEQRNIYVANGGSNSVTVYAAGATGPAKPIQDISGADTGLANPFGVAGDIYVSNLGVENEGTITVYASGANGDAAPIQTVAGQATRISFIAGIGIDTARNIYVAASLPYGRPAIMVFAAGSNGNVAPIQTIAGNRTRMSWPGWLAIH